jgi:glyoxylate reductase
MGRSALLIGSITHARKEWDELSSLLGLKVSKRGVTSYVTKIADNDTGVQDWLKR